MPGDETSFTIIAFPKPEIGPDFEDIFRETIAINTTGLRKIPEDPAEADRLL